jgi:hypothetical protein
MRYFVVGPSFFQPFFATSDLHGFFSVIRHNLFAPSGLPQNSS